MSFLKPKQKEYYLAISEGEKGIEYFFDKDIKKLPIPIKRSITTFLIITIEQLKEDEKEKE